MRNEFFGGLLYDRVGKDYYHLDPLSVQILTEPASAGDGARLAVHGATEADAQDVLRELARMEAIGNTFFLGNDPVPGMLSAPMRVFYEITYRCPEKCTHCYTESDRKEAGELALEEKFGLVDQLVQMGCFRVSVAGGEPLVDRDFFPFLEYALDRGVDVSFSTNATLITERVARELARLDVRTINVSLDGWDDETFGAVRGMGRLKFVQRGVARLREHYRGTIAAKCTLMKTNLDQIDKIIDAAVAMGFDTVKFNCVREAGRAVGTDLAPTQEQYLRVIAHLADRYNQGTCPIRMVLPVNPYQDRTRTGVDTLDELGFGCYAGKESFCVTPVGDITPCSSFGRGQYVDGNMRTMTLREAWLQGGSTQLFRGLDGSSECRGCASYAGCRGGCYLRSLRSTGVIDGVDPYCYERKNTRDIDGTPMPRQPVPVTIRSFGALRPAGTGRTGLRSVRRMGRETDALG